MSVLIKGIGTRIWDGQFVRAIYGAITKSTVEGNVPEDLERITSDTDLANFVAVTSGAYNHIMVQVQTATIVDETNQTPHQMTGRTLQKINSIRRQRTITTLQCSILKKNFTSSSLEKKKG